MKMARRLQIYLKPASDNKNGGFALVSAERTEVSVIFIDGSLGFGDLMKSKGIMGGDSDDPKADNKSKTSK